MHSLAPVAFLDHSFTTPELNNKGYCVVAKEIEKAPTTTAVVGDWDSFSSLPDDYVFWTPNTFFKKDTEKTKGELRWLNAMFIDLDKKDHPDINLPDLLSKIRSAGLPEPSLIVQTPSKGYHIYWALTPARATFKTIRLYEVLTLLAAQEIGGDVQAVGAERFMRLPKMSNIVFQTPQVYSLDTFKNWREVNDVDTNKPSFRTNVTVLPKGILQHPAFQKLLRGVSWGIRDNTCFTLALAFRVEGYTEEQTIEILKVWNRQNTPPLPESHIKRKTKSAFSGKYRRPSAAWVTELSGIDFSYRYFTSAQPRQDRVRSHISEWQQDILDFLASANGTWTGSQADLAKALSAPLRSIKEALKCLVSSAKISLRIEGKGRAAKTTIIIIVPSKIVKIFPAIQQTTFHQTQVFFEDQIVHTDIHSLGLFSPSLCLPVRGSPG